jgi:hypothetical protein
MKPARGFVALELSAVGVLLSACFGPTFLGNRQFAFRDSAHYYYPLYQRVQQEWEAGRWPLWAPEINGGSPLLADPTAAVLYPGKLVFAVLPYSWALRAYVVAHVILAYATMRAAARNWGISPVGSALAAQAYAFGAPILFQYSNVVFLVGAAWAPLAFRGADRWVRQDRRGGIGELALALALQFLGGDAEAAYLSAVCAAGYAAGLNVVRAPRGLAAPAVLGLAASGIIYMVLLFLASLEARSRAPGHGATLGWPGILRHAVQLVVWVGVGFVLLAPLRFWTRGSEGRSTAAIRFGGLALAVALALLISGAQLVPALEYAAHSLRGASIRSGQSLRFSLPLPRLAEWIWPIVSGSIQNGNRAWIRALPPQWTDTIWEPTLYMGGLTIVLAVSAAGFRERAAWCRWLTVVAAFSLLAALGRFGSPVFWARCLTLGSRVLGPRDTFTLASTRSDGCLSDGDGGFYWLLSELLPGFRAFRFPCKTLTFTCLSLAGLAGAGWDRLTVGRTRAVRVWAVILAVAGLVCWAAVAAKRVALVAWLSVCSTQDMGVFGPLDAVGAVDDLESALVYGCLGLGFVLGLALAADRRWRWAGPAALAFLTADLARVGSGLVWTVPQAVFEEPVRGLELIRRAENDDPADGPYRVYHLGVGVASPPDVTTRRSWSLETVVRWQRSILVPFSAISEGMSYTYFEGSTVHFDYAFFFDPFWLRLDEQTVRALRLKLDPGQEMIYYPRRGLDLWGSRYFIVPATMVWDDPRRAFASLWGATRRVYPEKTRFEGPDGPAQRRRWLEDEDFQVLRNEDSYPRAWLVHRARTLPPISGFVRSDRRDVMRELLYQDDEFWHGLPVRVFDPRRVAWVETETPRSVARFLSGADPDPSERVTITRYDPQRVELTASLKTPGLIILADVDYPGWRLTLDGRPAEILRTNRLMRGALVGAGTHQLVYTYEPPSFRVGLCLSMVGLVGLTLVFVWRRADAAGPREMSPSATARPPNGEPGA